MKRHLPNFITLLNVFCGCIATIYAVSNELELAAVFVVLGIVFDFFDGFAARLLNVKSDLGLQLDSLADMITSGLVPGIVMFQLFKMAGPIGWNVGATFFDKLAVGPLAFFGFVVTMASAYRLAKFNIDENQTTSFIGLPTPANAILILSLPLIMLHQNSELLNGIILNHWFLIGFTVLSAFLLNSNIKLFALKFKNWQFQENALRYIFIIVSLVLLITMKFVAIPVIIGFYILSSLVTSFSKN